MQINRLIIFIYNILIVATFIIRITTTGPVLYDRVWLFWSLFSVLGIGIFILSYFMLFHPTPLEIVSYHINLIMRHYVGDEDGEYDFNNKLYLSEQFIKSASYEFFYYGHCCAKIDQYTQMKIKLVKGQTTYNKASMIIKTMDNQYIKFMMVKNTRLPFLSLFYGWVIDQVEYSNHIEFLEALEGQT